MIFKVILSFLCYFLCNFPNINAENEEKVIQYNAETFPVEILKNNHFVMFYAPWCGFCKRLHPTWEQLADVLKDDPENQIVIAKVDCTVDFAICSENDVTGYPTLKFFKAGSNEGVKFKGTRDLPSLTSFINEQLKKSPSNVDDDDDDDDVKTSPVTTNGLTELTETSFNDFIQSGNFFVKFYAPWCGHCQKLAPTWEDLAMSLESESNVGIAKVDCTAHKNICITLGIKGYPTLLWMQDGKVIEKYQGPRTESDLKSFVNKMLGAKKRKPEEETDISGSGGMVILNSENFQKGISQGLSFVKFFAPWCGHCKRLAPIWSELDKKISEISDVRLVKVDCTQDNSKDLCNRQEVEGFPTLFLYKNGEKISEYNGSRNLEDMYEFLSKHFPHDEL